MRGPDDGGIGAVCGGNDALWTVLLQGGGGVCECGRGAVRLSGRDYDVRERVLPGGRGVRERRHEHVSGPSGFLSGRAGRLRQHLLSHGPTLCFWRLRVRSRHVQRNDLRHHLRRVRGHYQLHLHRLGRMCQRHLLRRELRL